MDQYAEFLAKPVVYRPPGLDQVTVRRGLVYREVGGAELGMDVYRPVTSPDQPRPAVVFIHGEAPPRLMPMARSWGQLQSWGRLAAHAGLIGIVFNHRSTRDQIMRLHEVGHDVTDLVHFVRRNSADLGVDPDRLGFWGAAAGVPYLQIALENPPDFVRCLVAYYGLVDLRQFIERLPPRPTTQREELARAYRTFSLHHWLEKHGAAIPPTLLVKAALDHEAINDSLDRFVDTATELGAPVRLLEHPRGRHAFDVVDDVQSSHEIIQRTLAFFQQHLLG